MGAANSLPACKVRLLRHGLADVPYSGASTQRYVYGPQAGYGVQCGFDVYYVESILKNLGDRSQRSL